MRYKYWYLYEHLPLILGCRAASHTHQTITLTKLPRPLPRSQPHTHTHYLTTTPIVTSMRATACIHDKPVSSNSLLSWPARELLHQQQQLAFMTSQWAATSACFHEQSWAATASYVTSQWATVAACIHDQCASSSSSFISVYDQP